MYFCTQCNDGHDGAAEGPWSPRTDTGRPGGKWKAPLGQGFLWPANLQDIVSRRVQTDEWKPHLRVILYTGWSSALQSSMSYKDASWWAKRALKLSRTRKDHYSRPISYLASLNKCTANGGIVSDSCWQLINKNTFLYSVTDDIHVLRLKAANILYKLNWDPAVDVATSKHHVGGWMTRGFSPDSM